MEYTYEVTTAILWLAWFIQWRAYRKMIMLYEEMKTERDAWHSKALSIQGLYNQANDRIAELTKHSK